MAQLIDSLSVPSCKSEIDLFSVPSTQVAVEKGNFVQVNPVNTITELGPYDFHISPDPHFLDLNCNFILMQLKVVNADGTDIAQGDVVGPINLIGKTFFKQVKLYLNSKLIYDSGDTYAYRAYLETQLNYGFQPKKTQLEACGYANDEPGDQVNAIANVGFMARVGWFATSAVVELIAPLHLDLFHQEKYLLNKMDLRLELNRNENTFALMCFTNPPASNYKLMIQSIKWCVKKIDLAPSVSLAIESILLRTPVKYPVRRVQIKAIELEAGRRDTPTTAVFNGQIPRRIILGCVSSGAFHGTYRTSPFNFKNFTANSIQVIAGGVSFPANPLKMDFRHRQFSQAYMQLYEELGIAGSDKSCSITMNDFQNSNCFYAFNLTPDSSDGNQWELIREGSTTIQMSFRDPIPVGGVKLIVYAEFDNLIMIDRFRNVFFDYTP